MSTPPDHHGDAIRIAAPAKVNLSLRVLAREDNGFHQVETLFCALELADQLEFQKGGDGIRLEVEGAEIGPVQDNLVHRAARAFFAAVDPTAGVRIRLRKEVPAGAGLGGGSSDAAATLHALNELYSRPLGHAALADIGAALGSDVPFFLCGSPLALAWGRGERLMPLQPLPQAPALVVAPGFGILTAEAYRELDTYRASNPAGHGAALVRPDALRSWSDVAAIAVNDFEAPTFARFPELAGLKSLLGEAGAMLALLSGSGSAVFGIFPDPKQRDAAMAALRAHGTELRLIATSTAGIVAAPGQPIGARVRGSIG